MVCSRMESSEICGTANVTCRVKSGSAVSIWTAARLKFAAPRFNASRVSPGFSLRSAMVTGIHSVGAGSVTATRMRAPVKGIGCERWSSTVSRSHGHVPAGKETWSRFTPFGWRKIGWPCSRVCQRLTVGGTFDAHRFDEILRRGFQRRRHRAAAPVRFPELMTVLLGVSET